MEIKRFEIVKTKRTELFEAEGYEVIVDGESSGHLCLGELLEQVTSMIHPEISEYAYPIGRKPFPPVA